MKLAVAAGLVVLALAIGAAIVGMPAPCGDLPRDYPPMIAFELARSAADLHALFGDHPSRCRDSMIQSMDGANVLDLALFIPAYTVFLMACFAGLRARAARLARAGAALAIAAALGDVAENVCLMALTPELDPASPWLARLPWVTGVKWLALGAAGAVAAVILARGGLAAKLGAAVCLLAPVAAIAAMVQPARFGPYLATGVAASWVVLLIVAFAGVRTVGR